MLTAATRRSAAARLEERRVFELSTRPPEILLPGARQSHDAKCLAVGHFVMSSPHSATRRSVVYGPIPWTWLTSVPRSVYIALRRSKAGSFLPLAWRTFGIGVAGGSRSSFS